MLKVILIVSLFVVSAMSKSVDINETVQKYIDTVEAKGIKEGGLVIEKRKITATGESFIATLTKSKLDDNLTDDSYDNLLGVSFTNDINYTKDIVNTVTTLINFPTKNLDKNESDMVKKIIDKKLIVLRSNYSVQDHLYRIALDDINSSLDKIEIKSKKVQFYGYYDQNDSIQGKNSFSIESIEIKPATTKFLGDYLIVKNLLINDNTIVNGDVANLEYKISVDLVDANISSKQSKVQKVNLDIRVANLDAKTYRLLKELGSQDPQTVDPVLLESLGTDVIMSKGLFVELRDLSISNLINNGKSMGSAKINAKVSLDIDPKNAKLIALNPLMALSSLSVDARVELSKEMIATLMKDPRAMMLAMLPPKEENGNIVYVIKYANGKLSVNGQALGGK